MSDDRLDNAQSARPVPVRVSEEGGGHAAIQEQAGGER